MKDWNIAPPYSYEDDTPQYNPIILQLLYNRGLKTKEAVSAFFNPDSSDFDPFLFRDMAKATDLIISHIKNRNKITVYGDYDADGITSSSILTEALRSLSAEVEIYIPDRVSEGYGLNKKALDFIASSGTKLVITVDNGIRNKPEVEYAKSLGLDIIVSDHHVLPENSADLPECLIINPADQEDEYPWKKLCGAGVAFKIVEALVSRSTLDSIKKKDIIHRAFDLAAIGTIGDLVPMMGENRLIAKRGLIAINRKERLGLRELISESKINGAKELEAWNVSWQIVPRLNAASRMEHADTAVSLLLSKTVSEAHELAVELNNKNMKRQAMTEDIFNQAEASIKDKKADILIAVSPDDVIWNEGLIGLAAGKISEKYYRPALVIAKTEEGSFKSSGRSIEEFNLIEAISSCSEFLSKYGGHPMACGFSLKGKDNLEGFIEAISKIASDKLSGKDISPRLSIDMEIDLDDIDMTLFNTLKEFEPFGQDNPKPIFVSRQIKIADRMLMGNDSQHLKLKVATAKGSYFSALSFSASDDMMGLAIGDVIDLAYNIDVNFFNGRTEIQLKIVDVKR